MRRLMIAVCTVSMIAMLAPMAAAKQPKGGAPEDHEVVGYFIQWGVYGRQFFVKNLVDNGSADKLTVVNYAFGNVAPNEDGEVVCQSGDPWADYQLPFSAENSVDGVADAEAWGAELRGNFNQLRELKEQYPDLRVLISLGGWTWSQHFSDAALTRESRRTLVESCIDLFIEGNLPEPGWGATEDEGAAAGVFDGIDLDWEWPGSEGHPHNTVRPEDKENFTALVKEFRGQLDKHGREVGEHYELTAFLPAATSAIDAGFEVKKLMKEFDFATFQGYDLAGAWDLSSTNHHSKLFAPEGDPLPQFSVDQTVQAYLDRGAPAHKLVMGVPFYGRGWTGVNDSNNGLYQPATAAAPGTFEAGFEDYKVLKTLTGEGFTRYWDADAKVPWLFDGTTFWTYDDPESLGIKADYVLDNGLGGMMFWEVTGDTADGELITAIHEGLND